METRPVDLEPAARRMAELVAALPDEALDLPTPCEDVTVADLLDHVSGAALAFRAAAVKDPLPAGTFGEASHLGADWRTRIPQELLALVEAWRRPEAWEGMTQAGGVDLPGGLAGVTALDELVIHGWDLATATGQPTAYEGPELEAVLSTVEHFRASGLEGLFGPPVPIADDAPVLDRILGLAGRDPGWQPPDRTSRADPSVGGVA
jgi:uncharacterized protein (TIGR03086 family)